MEVETERFKGESCYFKVSLIVDLYWIARVLGKCFKGKVFIIIFNETDFNQLWKDN